MGILRISLSKSVDLRYIMGSFINLFLIVNMLNSLKKILKKLVPRTLFGRFVVILLTPLVLVQCVLGYIFFDRHTETILRQISTNLAGEVSLTSQLLNEEKNFKILQETVFKHFELGLEKENNNPLSKVGTYKKTWLYTFLDEAFKKKLGVPYFIRMDRSQVYIFLEANQKTFKVSFPRKRLFSRTTPLVLIWTTISSILLFLVALIFMKNQVRPILRLTRAAEKFGRTGKAVLLKPEGALEIRKTGFAFILMQSRIKRQLSDRLALLRGISRELKIFLDNIKNKISFISPLIIKQEVEENIIGMEKIIEGLSTYAQETTKEKEVNIELSAFLETIASSFRNDSFECTINCEKVLWIKIRPMALKQCFENLLVNCQEHSAKCMISVSKEKNLLTILIDDNGQGIPLTERENVFKPFYKLNHLHNIKKKSIGLGLSTVKNIINEQGGQVYLKTSSLGGIRVVIEMPL